MAFDYEITVHLMNMEDDQRDLLFDEIADLVYGLTKKTSTDVLVTVGPPKEN